MYKVSLSAVQVQFIFDAKHIYYRPPPSLPYSPTVYVHPSDKSFAASKHCPFSPGVLDYYVNDVFFEIKL